MQDEIRLTPTSFIVLGLIAHVGEATPYDLKRIVAASVGNFWSLQHAQLYTEPARLAAAGYLNEDQEAGGRRRKRYAITSAGQRALAAWVAEPVTGTFELRDPGLLKLFFGADPVELGRAQLELHERQLAEYEAMRDLAPARGPLLALEAGIGHQREWVRFWRRLSRDPWWPAALTRSRCAAGPRCAESPSQTSTRP